MTTFEKISIFFNIGSLILVGIGIYQLNLTKKDINLREKRESTLLAGSLCEKYQQVIKEHYEFESNLRQSMGKKDLDELENHKYPLNKKLLCNNYLKKNENLNNIFEKEFVKNNRTNFNLIINFLNQLELIAIYFNEGIASKKVAFYVMGNSYCSIIEFFMPIILFFRCTDCGGCTYGKNEIYSNIDGYEPLLDLYIEWKS